MKTEQLTLEYLEQMTDPTKFKPFQVKLKEGALPKIKLRRSATYNVQSVQKPSKVFKTYQLHIGRNWYNADMFRLVTEQEETIDLSKYKAFPEGYKVPKGIKVIAIKESRQKYSNNYSFGKTGVTKDYDDMPNVLFEGKDYSVVMYSHELAPLNPADHPDYQPDHSVTDQFQPEPIHPEKPPITEFGRLRIGSLVRGYLPCDAVTIIGKIERFDGIDPVVYGIKIDYTECELYNEDVNKIDTLIQYVSEHRDSMSKDSILHFANLIGLIKLGAL